jgi:hypothetical protein
MRWATRLAQLPVQIAWICALGGVIGALFVVPRVRFHPPRYAESGIGYIVARGDDTVLYDLEVGGKTFHDGGVYYGTKSKGDPIDVWYDPADPSNATTLRDQPVYDYGKGSLLVLAFPVGVLVVGAIFMWNGRRFRLLRYGRAVEATLRSTDPTRGGRVAYLRFKYEIEGTEHHADLTTVRRDDGRDTEIILYDAADPHHACALSDLTCSPTLEGDRFVPTTFPYLAFLVPLATLATVVILVVKTL